MPPETTKPTLPEAEQTAQITVPVGPTNAPAAAPPEPISPLTPETQTAQMEGNEPNSPILAPDSSTNLASEVVPDPEPSETVAEAKPPVPRAGQAGVEESTETPIQPPEAKPKTPEQSEKPQVVAAPPPQNSLRSFLSKAMAVVQRKKTKKLEKILTEITRKGKISNDEVEKLLHVSDATATRYLSQLEREEKIKQTGKTGRSVFYTKM